MSKHTEGEIVVITQNWCGHEGCDYGNHKTIRICDKDGLAFISLSPADSEEFQKLSERSARIESLWNACEGIANPEAINDVLAFIRSVSMGNFVNKMAVIATAYNLLQKLDAKQ